eukprot:CAMPEP_0179345818 /NCGR_PEP_ID=MMETSP0797-20121207/72247_1 /TAXON_ID=47934 /ORGANISM="Dinophysis acuminata, Strain DAEP01" /LENGTH=120 /DNA_ID=CAMNT_0021060333 /DNA_START=6 /DNA_END=364 /DNA_ORIENTATION=+
MRAAVLLASVLPIVPARPPDGSGVFEQSLRDAVAGSSVAASAANPFAEVRVVKALGSKGYGKLRVSVIGPPGLRNATVHAGQAAPCAFTYAEPFRYRWQAAADLGRPQTSCAADPGAVYA